MWFAFLATVSVVAISPGPGAAAVMGAGIGHGLPAALRVVLGLQLALLLQLSVVAVGLGALLAASETAFNVIRLSGAAYLIWLGIKQLLAPPTPLHGSVEGRSIQGGDGYSGGCWLTCPTLRPSFSSVPWFPSSWF